MVNIPFINFAYKSTGGTANRTTPDRLAEVKNVMDFGAYNDNTHATETTAAIQTAVDWTSGANRGTIFFPAGNYATNAPINFNYDGDLSIRFLGESQGTFIGGTVDGYLFDRSLGSPNNTTGGRIFEGLGLSNAHATGGCIRIGSSKGAVIRDCTLSGHINITTEDSAGNSSENVLIQSCQFAKAGNTSGSHHIIMGGGGSIQNCGTKNGAEVFCRAYGSGLHASGNRVERCYTTWMLGKDSAGTASGLKGFSITSATFEGNWCGFDFAGPCDGFYIGSQFMMGHDETNAGVETPDAHGTEYSFRIRANNATNGLIENCVIGSWHEVAGISIDNSSARTNLLFRNNSCTATGGGGSSWVLPTNAYTARLENCNTAAVWTFSQLASEGGSNVLEGEEFDISDCNTTTWGANAAGSGSSRVRVRYNGTHYTVVGK